MLSSVPAPDDQCPRVLDQIDDTWEWLGDKLVKLPARRPVVQFPPGSLHRIAPVRDVIWTSSESSPVFRVKALPYFSGCLTFAQTWEVTLSGSPDLRRGSVLTEGAKQTASHASHLPQSAPSSSLYSISCHQFFSSSNFFLALLSPARSLRALPMHRCMAEATLPRGCIFATSLSLPPTPSLT